MRCPFCKVDDDKVIDSRASSDGFAIRRRRECLPCGRRFTTYERIEESPLRVIKKDGGREPFERRKVLLGLIKACEKRPIAIAVLEEITERIENHVLEEYDSEVPVQYIGELVMRELKDVDQVAYVRFASVYREFKDINEFMDELKGMLSKPARAGRPARRLAGGGGARTAATRAAKGTSTRGAKKSAGRRGSRAGGEGSESGRPDSSRLRVSVSGPGGGKPERNP